MWNFTFDHLILDLPAFETQKKVGKQFYDTSHANIYTVTAYFKQFVVVFPL